MILTSERAAGFARLTLGHIGREYPYKLDQMLTGPEDLAPPSVRHPIFHGSFDWHSCCHGWWQLLTIARLFPGGAHLVGKVAFQRAEHSVEPGPFGILCCRCRRSELGVAIFDKATEIGESRAR